MAGSSVAIVGGGWAGCAAAVALTDAGHRVALLEAGSTLGGRARRVVRDGFPIDNGAHLLLGAYRETLRLVRRMHSADQLRRLLDRRRLALLSIEAGNGRPLHLRAAPLPAPLGLLAGILAARGLAWRDRVGVVRWFAQVRQAKFRRPPGETVEAMLASCPPNAARKLWAPLCLAALNTPPDRACAQTFANVLAAAFAQRAADSDLVFALADLSALFPDAAARHLAAAGGTMSTGCRAAVVAIDHDGVTIAVRGSAQRYDAAVVAVAPHQLVHAFAPAVVADLPALSDAVQAVASFRYEPITTVWLGYPRAVRVPAPVVRLDDAPGQWLFDRPDIVAAGGGPTLSRDVAQMLAVVVSASGPHLALGRDALADAIDAQLRRAWPGLAAPTFRQVVVERRATYACEPGRASIADAAVHPRLILAGDYVDRAFPATIEAAVRTGLSAAQRLDRRLVGGS